MCSRLDQTSGPARGAVAAGLRAGLEQDPGEGDGRGELSHPAGPGEDPGMMEPTGVQGGTQCADRLRLAENLMHSKESIAWQAFFRLWPGGAQGVR